MELHNQDSYGTQRADRRLKLLIRITIEKKKKQSIAMKTISTNYLTS